MNLLIRSLLILHIGLASPLRAANVDLAVRPNIVFILVDDMGYSDMSWQGSPIRTPHLDKLRAEGIFLERNYVQPQCSPSRVAFLSGRYPYRFGLHEHIVLPWSLTGLPGPVPAIAVDGSQADDGPLFSYPPGTKSVAAMLKQAGYRTAHIGKWHVGGHLQSQLPHNQGFDESFACINGAISYWNYTHRKRNDLIHNGRKFYAASDLDSEASGNTYATDLWAQKAVEVILNHDPKRPLFMYLAPNAPHDPFQAPKKMLDRYPLDQIEPYWAGPTAAKNRQAANRRTYMAMVEAMDAAIGEVVQSLREKNMLDNTLIVFCSDNGGIVEADNRPLRSFKGDSFEGGIRVPGIAFWPGMIKPGSTSSELVHMADWYPTFAELAGVDVKEEEVDGVSAVGVLRGDKALRQSVPIISESRHALVTRDHSLVGGGSDHFKLLQEKLLNFQLFDLAADISQKRPTAARPEIAQQLRQELAAHFQNVNRGYFNWDIVYNQARLDENKGDHSYDMVVNDLPKISVSNAADGTKVTISPVRRELIYHLETTRDGRNWKGLSTYACLIDATHYTFPPFQAEPATTQYRVRSALRLGLPVREAFSLTDKYRLGTLGTGALPALDGFLPRCDVTGRVEVIDRNLVHEDWPQEGGALRLAFDANTAGGSFTRYFVQPHSRGKLYASMLVQFESLEAECLGEINWLRQEGWNGPTVSSAALVFQGEDIYLNHDDSAVPAARRRIGDYRGQVVCVVFEFDLGTTGQDTLKVYLNPPGDLRRIVPVATSVGEFTVDRLQFAVAGRPGSRLTLDELRVGTTLEHVIPKPHSD
jgi:arylsulfatase A-like enzyme